jgi:hypothetical protein
MADVELDFRAGAPDDNRPTINGLGKKTAHATNPSAKRVMCSAQALGRTTPPGSGDRLASSARPAQLELVKKRVNKGGTWLQINQSSKRRTRVKKYIEYFGFDKFSCRGTRFERSLRRDTISTPYSVTVGVLDTGYPGPPAPRPLQRPSFGLGAR